MTLVSRVCGVLHRVSLCISYFALQVHVQNATLAGGVAVGAVANMMLQPWGAMFIGFSGGIISVVGFRFLSVREQLKRVCVCCVCTHKRERERERERWKII